jgi:arylformamidase
VSGVSALYRGLNAQQLKLEYSPSLSVPDTAACVESWRQRSEQLRGKKSRLKSLNLAYGEKPAETLDIFSPGENNAPVHVYIHGGYWQQTDKTDYSFLSKALIDQGVCVVIPNYTLCPAISIAGIVDQMQKALIWIYRNIESYNGDPQRIQVSGHSAGGHLTAMMALTDWQGFADDLPANLVKSGVSISGVFDLEPLIHTPINDALGLDHDTARKISPLYCHAQYGVPMVFAVGGLESSEFIRQNQAMYEHWRQRGYDASLVECAEKHHFTVINDLVDPGSKLFQNVMTLLS